MRFYFVRANQIYFYRKLDQVLNQLWGKGLKHFQDQYIERQTNDNGAQFRIMKVHEAFNLDLKGLLVLDEWDITWERAENECDEGISNFIIVGQTGIGVHRFPHVFLLLSADIVHLGRLSLFTIFLHNAWHSVSQPSFKTFLNMYGSSTRAEFIPLSVTYRGWRYVAYRKTTLLGPSLIQIGEWETLPLFYSKTDHHFSSWKPPFLITTGVGRNTTG